MVRGPRPATMSPMPGFRARAGRMRSAEEEIQKPQQAGTDRGPLLWTLRLPIRQPGSISEFHRARAPARLSGLPPAACVLRGIMAVPPQAGTDRGRVGMWMITRRADPPASAA